MNLDINHYKFYRKNNRYYFESSELEGRISISNKEVIIIAIENGEFKSVDKYELIDLFNENIQLILNAEAV